MPRPGLEILDELRPTEVRILRLRLGFHSNAQIAHALRLSPQTIKVYLHRIRELHFPDCRGVEEMLQQLSAAGLAPDHLT